VTPTFIGWLIGIVVPAILLLDVYLAVDNRVGNTYSEVLRKWFKSYVWLYYTILFAVGVLFAHWGQK
jgi:hypothetical protein